MNRFSGGQLARLLLAHALIQEPDLLLLDEPTNAMDNTTELVFKQHFCEFIRDKTLLLVTHKASMLSLVDRLLVLDHGKLVADGPRDEILKALSQGASNTG